ncbi:hypothetical protein HYFRA_00006082 [Hymenoscyphus fraxineus]|uniref:Protein kinase domain-containing protein n=1 Tax=Hymenoscyphus fraxineus TaxID=746836 RepID=A0A9N9PIH8_9HELO|nr:hypothetical protein HYFRA_00006082 [Hymenoscyphus fraxineus]
MADPGTIIAVVTISYKVAIKAWSAFQDALNYDDESADVVVRLEIERFRFQTWALNAGLTKGTFDPNLHPIHELVAERLNRITKLFEEAEKVKESFGLTISDAARTSRPDKAHSILSGMASSIRSMGMKLDIEEKTRDQDSKKVSSRIKWALVSKANFLTLVSTLESTINKLDGLLTETQRRSERDDWKRINIVLVGNVPPDQLDLLQRALRHDLSNERPPNISGIDSLVAKKAIHHSSPVRTHTGAHSLARRELDEFFIQDLRSRNRLLALPKPAIQGVLGPGPFLLERKEYDPDINIQDKRTLKARLDRLILLLSSRRSDDFRAFQAVGYCEDPSSFSWWLIFQCPFSDSVVDLGSSQLVSLKSLFPLKYKPPLEDRLKLASLLSKTLAELFNSGWMHKGIRSENVLFPDIYDKGSLSWKEKSTDVSTPYLGGFEYSRQDTEAATIDKGKQLRDLQSAIYRHPEYQGEAATGYKMKYDIYSFGMVLTEIALWIPISTMLDAKGVKSNSVKLSSGMTTFHTEEALELKTRVLGRVRTELAFRVGSPFRDVVHWCLTMSEADDEEDWHPALGFHNNVVSPLEKCILPYQ